MRRSPNRSGATPKPWTASDRPPTHLHSPSPIHPSPLPGGRLGGGWEATRDPRRHFNTPVSHTTSPTVTPPTTVTLHPQRHPALPTLTPHPNRHSCAPPPSFLRRQEPGRPPAPLRAAVLRRLTKAAFAPPNVQRQTEPRLRVHSCLRRNDGRGRVWRNGRKDGGTGARMTGTGARMTGTGARMTGTGAGVMGCVLERRCCADWRCARSRALTPHPTSPLEGGG